MIKTSPREREREREGGVDNLFNLNGPAERIFRSSDSYGFLSTTFHTNLIQTVKNKTRSNGRE